MTRPAAPLGLVVVGGGPAALAPFVSASRDGRLGALLGAGVAFVEAGPALGSGDLGRYEITSDSSAATFLTAVTGHRDRDLDVLRDHPVPSAMRVAGNGAVPLTEAAALLDLVGGVLSRAALDAGAEVLTGHEALRTARGPDGTWATTVRRRSDGAVRTLASRSVLVATGGRVDGAALEKADVAGAPLLPAHATRHVTSHEVLSHGGAEAVGRRLADRAAPRVVVVGGATSALAVVTSLLRRLPDVLSAPGCVTVLHRRDLVPFYPDRESALAEGCRFGPDDVCPVSGQVFRLAGFRLDSRELLLSVRGVGGRPREDRVVLRRIGDDPEAARRTLGEADVVVSALGYVPRLLPVHDADGAPVRLAGADGGRAVDGRCRLLDAEGTHVPGLLGLGLAMGYVPSGALGGEPSFRGRANGLWSWQNGVGAMVVDGVLERAAAGGDAARPCAGRSDAA